MPRNAQRSTPVIKDVAKLAGVSAPTVSRYLNGTAKVNEEKRERIAQAIKLLGYKPSVVARALANKEMDSVMVFATNSGTFSTNMTSIGVENGARERNYLFNVTTLSEDRMDEVRPTVQMALGANPAGVVVYEYDHAGAEALRYIPDDIPLVIVGGNAGEGRYQVINSEREGGHLMTRYLLGLGHRTVYHVGRPQGPSDNTRTNGWRDAMAEAGIAAPPVIEVSATDLSESVEAGRRIAGFDDATAVFAGNDETAIAVIKGLREAGKRVPEDVSVVGFDNRTFGPLWTPPLTSYSQNFVETGERAFSMLYEQIQARRGGQEPPKSRLETVRGEFVERGSALPFAG
ncbi:LacI family DNA-binding transcriptional regulator [Bifidobacterium simiarum]|uniref:LacI family transcriptional regulator n=1 Tax=Bifidobacterium simiarum TaxID=2045441 RepID=A0A2M9HFD9_9BIFI|nr:LacI family DNA-binding transcriptional regulator [Bifidobacterium simiarum]MBT1166550.1 LacI family DNA-binding transcriptional regulator [Bifidobacterium simiarum]PJM75506.1 LacI family transcriptional regulator [Bifidobacterium simiarum]